MRSRSGLCSLLAAPFMMLAACATHEIPSTAQTSVEQAEISNCIEDRAALLALQENEFDQNLNGGWRMIAQKQGCELEAADLLRDYRKAHPDAYQNILIWHEGQLRAGEGQTQAAIALFGDTYKLDPPDDAWNYYVGATIAFLEKDHDALQSAYQSLAALPKPDWFDQSAITFEEKYGVRPRWPSNIGVVEGFMDCFKESYATAYGECNRFAKAARDNRVAEQDD